MKWKLGDSGKENGNYYIIVYYGMLSKGLEFLPGGNIMWNII